MRAVRELRLRILKQLDEGFVDERGRLQGVTGMLAAHERSRHPSQLAVNERQQLVERRAIPCARAMQQTRDLAHLSMAGVPTGSYSSRRTNSRLRRRQDERLRPQRVS